MNSEQQPLGELARQMHQALRPIDPGEGFAMRVLARLPAAAPDGPAMALTRPHSSSTQSRRRFAAAMALAASVVIAVGVTWQLQDLRAQRRAEQVQLLTALEITSERLGAVQRQIERFQTQEKVL